MAEAPASVIYDETFDTPKGKLRCVVDLARLVTDFQNYQDKLMLARGIPLDQENIAPADPLVFFITQNMKWIPDDKVLWTVSERYKELAKQCSTYGVILAITREGNKFDFEPIPYATEEDALPKEEWEAAVPDFPEPNINMIHPMERRLKQIIDVMESAPTAALKMQKAIEIAFVTIQRGEPAEKDETGFQPQLVDKSGDRKNGGTGAKSKVGAGVTSP